jgi:hypothetical protein
VSDHNCWIRFGTAIRQSPNRPRSSRETPERQDLVETAARNFFSTLRFEIIFWGSASLVTHHCLCMKGSCEKAFLLAGEMAQLHSRMQHSQDVIESDHPDDVALGNHGHLADAVAAHPLQHGKNGFVHLS